MALRDVVLSQFSPELAKPMLEFGNYIGRLQKTDYLIFMARKALRLHDLLEAIGCIPAQKTVLTNHVLDLGLDRLKGKHVTLIDDTLILGTTLGSTYRLLRENNIDVSTLVLCADTNNWNRKLVRPDKIFVETTSQGVASFCAAEIQAFSIIPIPYLTDFPITRFVRLGSQRLIELTANTSSWIPFRLSSVQQEESGAYLYSVLPTDELFESLRDEIGDHALSFIELAKVRAYVGRRSRGLFARFVPIVTLKPMTERSVNALADRLSSSMDLTISGRRSWEDLDRSSTVGKFRILQHVFSALLGRLYLDDLAEMANLPAIRFDIEEATKHFGPWNRHSLSSIYSSDHRVLSEVVRRTFDKRARAVSPPKEVAAYTQEGYDAAKGDAPFQAQGDRSVLTDVTRLFLDLYKGHELPARKEARALGEKIFSATATEAPHRDRLNQGYSWELVVSKVIRDLRIRSTRWRRSQVSLVLDHLIDLGVAVPIISVASGVLYRAYRYGEDVNFANQEAGLAFHLVRGFLEGGRTTGVSAVELEKLLVSLLRVGIAKNWLKPHYGYTGTEGIARIGFHLHGAVPILPRSGEKQWVPEGQDSWLSGTLLRDGVVVRKGEHSFGLGTAPDASYIRPNAEKDANLAGKLLGYVIRGPSSPLSLNDFIVLTSCTTVRDTLLAATAELKIALDSVQSIVPLFNSADLGHKRVLDNLLSKLVSDSHAYVAFHSARMKIVGFEQERPRQVVRSASEYLRTRTDGDVLATLWETQWEPVLDSESKNSSDACRPLLRQVTEKILELSACIFTIELSLHSARYSNAGKADSNARKALESVCRKIENYYEALQFAIPSAPAETRRMIDRLRAYSSIAAPMKGPESAIQFALNRISSLRQDSRTLIEDIGNTAFDVASIANVVKFSHLLWYDIIDSTGEKSGLSGPSLSAYRGRVRAAKKDINSHLHAAIIRGKKQGVIVHCWQGPVNSTNDEKHIFLAGTGSVRWLWTLANDLQTHFNKHRVVARLIATATVDLGGSVPFRLDSDPEVNGERFWEHFSRFQKGCREIERTSQTGKNGVWFIGGKLASTRTSHNGGVPLPAQEITIQLENDLRPIDVTPVVFRYGAKI